MGVAIGGKQGDDHDKGDDTLIRWFSRMLIRLSAVYGCLFFAIAQALAQYAETNSSCILCHQTMPLPNDFCSVMPVNVWTNDDKHRQAFALLHDTDEKRKLVRQILGFELNDAFENEQYLKLKDGQDAETVRKVATVKACLRCHATWPKDAEAGGKFAHIPPVPLNLGVSCQACHGPGEKWDQPHRLSAWRVVTPEAKAALGFTDCRSTASKARLCASCHVGNMDQGKFVKHEWYAGGHPPLPSFELASFEAQMPAHWKSLPEKGAFAFRDAMPRDDDNRIADQIAKFKASKADDGFGIPAEAIKSSHREANFPNAAAAGLDPYSDLASAEKLRLAELPFWRCMCGW